MSVVAVHVEQRWLVHMADDRIVPMEVISYDSAADRVTLGELPWPRGDAEGTRRLMILTLESLMRSCVLDDTP